MSATPTTYTAAQIATALRVNVRVVLRALVATPGDGTQVVSGVTAQAWSFAALPAQLQQRIETAAVARGARNGEALLSLPDAEWQPCVPLADVAPDCVERAVKLQRALARMIEWRNRQDLTAADLERAGLEDYAREFGHAITARSLRDILARTLERAGGREDFNRLEIYLPEKPARKPAKSAVATNADFSELRDALRCCHNPAEPNLAEKSLLWQRAFEAYEDRQAESENPKKVKRALLKFLEGNLPFLVSPGAESFAEALRRSFDRKYKQWVEEDRHGAALLDKRPTKSGRWSGADLSPADFNAIIAHAVNDCEGRVSQAWRDLVEAGKLSENVTSYYLSNPASKSYVPRAIREAVRYEVAMQKDPHHGPKHNAVKEFNPNYAGAP